MPAMTKKHGGEWQSKIEEAQQFRKDKLVNNVKRYLALYRGDHWPSSSFFRRNDLITVNLTFPTIRNQIGYYYFQDPKLFVKPRNDQSELTAPLAESVLNYYWTETNVRRQQRFRIYDVLIFGHSIAEIGWKFETDTIKSKGKDERIYYNEYIRHDMPYVRRISPLRFGFDPNAEMDPIVESSYVFKELFQKLEDVKKNPHYKNVKDLEAEMTTNEDERHRYGEDVVKLIELHDRKHMKLYVFAQGYEKPLREEDHPYEDVLEGHNFEWLQFNHTPDESFGISQIALLEDQQHELNRTRTQMFHHRRRVSNRKYIYNEGSLTERQINKLEDAEGAAIVGVNDINGIKPLEDARLSLDIPLIESVIKQDIRELTGQPASQFGVGDEKRRPATEFLQIEQARANRAEDNLTLVEEDIRNCARKMLQCIQKFADREVVIKIVGPRGHFWQPMTKEDIQGEYETLIDPGSTTKANDAVKRKQSMDLLSLAMKIPGLNMRRAVSDVLDSFEVPRKDEYFGPKFDEIFGLAPAAGGQAPVPPQAPGQVAQGGVPTPAGIAENANQLGPVTPR